MPSIYLSPSTQEGNLYVTGGSEEYYMNLLADEMEPYLISNGISFRRNTPDMTAVSSIRESNQGNYDLHLALHSNGAPESQYGQYRGTDVYFYPSSAKGQEAAQIIAQNLKQIYPLPDRVRAVPTTRLGEVRQTRAPSVLVELAYHDNVDDATWIINNLPQIARNLVMSLTEYFGIPFVDAQIPREGVVATQNGYLNIRSYPSASAPIVERAYKGAPITVLGTYGDWYVVRYAGTNGYAASQCIRV